MHISLAINALKMNSDYMCVCSPLAVQTIALKAFALHCLKYSFQRRPIGLYPLHYHYHTFVVYWGLGTRGGGSGAAGAAGERKASNRRRSISKKKTTRKMTRKRRRRGDKKTTRRRTEGREGRRKRKKTTRGRRDDDDDDDDEICTCVGITCAYAAGGQ